MAERGDSCVCNLIKIKVYEMEKKLSIKKATENLRLEKEKAYNKYMPKKKNPMAIFVKGNIVAFLLSSVAWLYYSNQRMYEPEMHDYIGPYEDQRTYLEAIADTYIPFNNGVFDPHVAWCVTVFVQLVLALMCIGVVRSRSKSKKDIDVMLEVERLAKEHNLDSVAAKKMLKVAPSIVKNMSKDSRIFFDMVMEGKFSMGDKKFVNTVSAIIVGHLEKHPEDMKKVVGVFESDVLPKKMRTILVQQKGK